MRLDKILSEREKDLAIIVGNGINLFPDGNSSNSWEGILKELWNQHIDGSPDPDIKGMSLPEFSDIIALRTESTVSLGLQKAFCNHISAWEPKEHHSQFVTWAQRQSFQILTTNFDDLLSSAVKAKLYKSDPPRFTDYYPWDAYYSTRKIEDPCTDFGIWHINGMIQYNRSIRLSLSHYMGSVQRARSWLYSQKSGSLFQNGSFLTKWRGKHTWLQIILSKPLLIMGLSFDVDEVFLRWLLIERAKYFKKFEKMRQPAWYAYCPAPDGTPPPPGKWLFLKTIGVDPIAVDSYEEMYLPKTH